jgi:GGDEF domain-containing protein
MPAELERRAVLLAATVAERETLRRPFVQGLVPEWETVEADSFERARFLIHHNTCDVVLVDASLCRGTEDPGLAWLAAQPETPVVLLSEPAALTIAAAMEQGVRQWLPRDLALDCPRLLSAALMQAAEWGALRRRARMASEGLQDCRRQVNRMVNLLWDAVPVDTRYHWFTQSHMMNRLQEECARSARFGAPFTVAIGEIHRGEDGGGMDEESLGRWTVDRITKAKRLCDVVGQYGPHGFMLLLVNTKGAGAEHCCQRIREALQTEVHQQQVAIDAVFGLASCPSEGDDSKSLLSRAERALERVRL